MDAGRGFVHVYTGNGKGKTTAAFGLVVRAAGHGFRSYVGQFLKAMPYGEVKLLTERCGDLVTVETFGRPGHVSGPTPEDVKAAEEGLARAREALSSGLYKVVVLDEINVALFYKLLRWEDVREAIKARADGVEVVLTGRYAPEEAIEFADLVTEMQEVKHYYKSMGVTAREGIER
jgi:cob(I)alamin adenosyltransferase